MVSKKILWWTLGILVVILVFTVMLQSQFGLFAIQVERDSIYMDVEDRDFTFVEVEDELKAYDKVWLRVNDIGWTHSLERGPDPHDYFYQEFIGGDYIGRPGTACQGLSGSTTSGLDQCCKNLGYSRFYSDTGWNVCVNDIRNEPEYLQLFVGDSSHRVYNWDGTGDWPETSNDFADIINEECDLGGVSIFCDDANYAVSEEQNRCVYYQPIEEGVNCTNGQATQVGPFGDDFIECEMPFVEKEPVDLCQVKLTADTGNGKGYINLQVEWEGQSDLDPPSIVQPPIIDDTDDTVVEEPQYPDEFPNDEFDGGSALIEIIEQNLFVGILSVLILIILVLILFRR